MWCGVHLRTHFEHYSLQHIFMLSYHKNTISPRHFHTAVPKFTLQSYWDCDTQTDSYTFPFSYMMNATDNTFKSFQYFLAQYCWFYGNKREMCRLELETIAIATSSYAAKVIVWRQYGITGYTICNTTCFSLGRRFIHLLICTSSMAFVSEELWYNNM